MERGNCVREVLFPDFTAPATDRVPTGTGVGLETRSVHERLRRGLDISTATRPADGKEGGDAMALSNRLADRDEVLNTRHARLRGAQAGR